jgi:hypothetical protein
MKKSYIYSQILPASIISIIILIYIYQINLYAVNIPFLDDYNVAFAPTKSFFESPTWLGKLKVLFSTHEVHNILITRLVFIGNYLLFGKFNFAYLCFFNAFLLLLIVYYLFRLYRKYFIGYSLWYFVPVVLFFLHLGNSESTLWAMSGIQNIGVVVLGLALFYYALDTTFNGKYFALCTFLAFFTTFSSGNGIFPILILLPFITYQQGFRRWQPYAWLAVCLGLLYLKSLDGVLVKSYYPIENPVINMLYRTDGVLVNASNLLGSLYANPKFTVLSIYKFVVAVMSFVLLLSFLYALQTQYQKQQSVFIAFGLFALVSILAIADVRGVYAPNIAFNSRYMIYSCCFSAITYFLLLFCFENKPLLRKVFLSIVLFITTTNYYQIQVAGSKTMEVHKETLMSYTMLWQDGGIRPIHSGYAYKDIVEIAEKYKQYYQIPAEYAPHYLKTSPLIANISQTPFPYEISSESYIKDNEIGNTNHSVFISGFQTINEQKASNNKVLLEITNEQATYTFEAFCRPHLYCFHNPMYLDGFFEVVIDKKIVKKGSYKIKTFIVDKKTGQPKASKSYETTIVF